MDKIMVTIDCEDDAVNIKDVITWIEKTLDKSLNEDIDFSVEVV